MSRTMRPLVLLAACALTLACDKFGGGEDARVNPAWLTNSSGEVSLADGSTMDYAITSERYKQWDRAREGLSRSVAARFGELLQPKAPTERSIQRSVTYLQSDARARQAIESAGLSVRGFVEMTVALEQQMQLATARGEIPPEAMPVMPYDTMAYQTVPPPAYPYPTDTFRVDTAIAPYPQPMPSPYPVDTVTRAPTVFRRNFELPAPDTSRRTDSVPVRRDAVLPPRPEPVPVPRRDSVLPRRDSISIPIPPRRDTARDTLPRAPIAPPDTIPPA
jgi:hypothetical protein